MTTALTVIKAIKAGTSFKQAVIDTCGVGVIGRSDLIIFPDSSMVTIDGVEYIGGV